MFGLLWLFFNLSLLLAFFLIVIILRIINFTILLEISFSYRLLFILIFLVFLDYLTFISILIVILLCQLTSPLAIVFLEDVQSSFGNTFVLVESLFMLLSLLGFNLFHLLWLFSFCFHLLEISHHEEQFVYWLLHLSWLLYFSDLD